MFGFEGVREVRVRKLAREEVGLDLVELRFKVRGAYLSWKNDIFSARVCFD